MTSQPGGPSSNSSNKPETVIAMKPEVAANDSGSSPKVIFINFNYFSQKIQNNIFLERGKQTGNPTPTS